MVRDDLSLTKLKLWQSQLKDETKSAGTKGMLRLTMHAIMKASKSGRRFWLCWDLTTSQPLWVILCRFPEKGRKEIEEIVEEMREGWKRKRNRNESEETEEIKPFPDTQTHLELYPYLLQG